MRGKSLPHRLLAVSAIISTLAGREGRAVEIPEGTRFYVSKRGQAWLKSHFEDLLLANGIDLSRRRIEETEFTLTNLTGAGAAPSSAHAKRPTPLERLASNLGAYFKGVPFREPPDLRFSMLAYRYELKFNRLTVEIDPRGPVPYGFNRGVVALLRGEASEFSFDLPRLRAVYPERPDFLGTLGLNGGRATLVKGRSCPAMMEIPVLIATDSKGLAVKVLAVRTNFTGVMLEASFEALLLPSIDVVIDGRRYSFDRAAFEQEVRKLLPEILQLLQAGVKRYFEADSATQIFQPQMDTVAKLASARFAIPLGTSGQPGQVDLMITPTQLKNDERNFMLAFRASMTDPLAGDAGPFLTRGSASAPRLGAVPPEGYDLAIALHPALLNGVLNRKFSHNFLSKVDVGGGELADLDAPPYLLLNLRDPRRVLLHVAISVDAHQWLVESRIPLEFDLRLRIAANGQNEIELVPEEILLDTVVVNTRRTRTFLGLFKGRVKSGVMARLKKTNDGFRTAPSVLERIPALDSVVGIPLRLVDVVTDNGNVVLFSKLELPEPRGSRPAPHAKIEKSLCQVGRNASFNP
jgi:hypothetical protein